MTTALFLVGVGLAVAGVAMVSTPAALIVAGGSLAGMAARYELGGDR